MEGLTSIRDASVFEDFLEVDDDLQLSDEGYKADDNMAPEEESSKRHPGIIEVEDDEEAGPENAVDSLEDAPEVGPLDSEQDFEVEVEDDQEAELGNDVDMMDDTPEIGHLENEEDYEFWPADVLPLTEECHHYQHRSEVPWDIQRYFAQRYSIFSWYDEGICLTDDAWFGVTPEPVANRIAEEMAEMYPEKKRVLIDMFAGAGGNSIAFSLSGRWDRVIAIEKDAATLACAQNNAECYEVEEGAITWVHGDSFAFTKALRLYPEVLHPSLRAELDECVVFASPPWGGPGYRTDRVFDLYGMQPYNLKDLHLAYRPFEHALFLPRTSDIRQLSRLRPDDKKIEVVQYCIEGASKAMVAYFPPQGKLTKYIYMKEKPIV